MGRMGVSGFDQESGCHEGDSCRPRHGHHEPDLDARRSTDSKRTEGMKKGKIESESRLFRVVTVIELIVSLFVSLVN